MQQAAPGQARLSEGLRLAAIGVLAGMAAGLVAGLGARIAMRVVALAAHHRPELSLATLGIVVMGVVLGISGGLLFVVVRRYLPGSGLGKGLVFGVLLLLTIGLPMLLPPATGELAIGPPLLGKSLFGALFIVYGLVVGPAAEWLEQRIPMPRRHIKPVVGYTLVVLLAMLGLFVFGVVIVSMFGVPL